MRIRLRFNIACLLKSRLAMTPLAISPPSSTPEPDMSSIPQDAATIPHSATPEVLTVCIYVNKQVNTGPNLDRQKVMQLPDHLGPARPSVVLQQAVQGCIDSAYQQKTVFTLLTQGYGGEKISATFDGKQHLLSLPVVNSVGYVLRFLKKLCRSLLSDSLVDDYHSEPMESKRYSVDHGDTPFGVMTSPYIASKSTYGFRSGAAYSSGSVCRPAASPSSFQEGNRSAYSPSPEAGESKPPPSKDPSRWSVEEVVWFIKDADPQALGPHVELFRKHEIDGDALLLLKSDMIMKYLGLKLGPALKLCYHIDKLKQNKF
ncbi:Sex comb on midleg-like protein 4 [Bagarius yarrelli]|uniref:Sex comb on midleg-like protein 4 n=1 Tax=Bagarius yarrelli TaxID=175774 RepID=A0A556TZL3_BAGYA|nr:Sex comb on midleg-like protein 4 [Bagarius yarrelli]